MFIYDDLTRQSISHFVGSFYLSIEEARARLDYLKFKAAQREEQAEETSDAQAPVVNVSVGYNLPDLDPDIHYEYSTPYLLDDIPARMTFPEWDEIDFRASMDFPDAPLGYLMRPLIFGEFEYVIINLPVLPNQYLILSMSINHLEDNDYLSNTGMEYQFSGAVPAVDVLYDGLIANGILHTFGVPDTPGKTDDLADVVTAWAASVESMAEAAGDPDRDPLPGEQVIAVGDDTQEIYVNGVINEEAPEFDTVLKLLKGYEEEEDEAEDEDEDDDETQTEFSAAAAEAPPTYVSGEAAQLIEFNDSKTSLDVSAGGNTLTNQAVLRDIWGKAGVVAVAGDYYDLDLISQVNVKLQSTTSPHMNLAGDPLVSSYNIASIVEEDTALPMDVANAPNEASWRITYHEGDMTFVNWLQQINYIVDNDAIIYQEDNSGTTLISGDNLLVNSATFFEFSSFYDLIIIGGNYYTANVINQTNVLVNFDEMVHYGTAAGGEAGTEGEIDNLLWNEAYIYSNYNADVESLGTGLTSEISGAAEGELGDDLMAALYGSSTTIYDEVNVLYVAGSVYDISYLEQVNVLGDSDSIATFGVDMTSEDTQINGDSNLLYNGAVIEEVGVETTIKVGGEEYSEALLYQAEFITDDTSFAEAGSSDLASEAVVFLADGMLSQSDNELETVSLNQVPDEVSVDPMATMVA